MSGDNVRLLGQINERTQKLEGDINKVWPLLDGKVNKENCVEHRTLICEKIVEAKRIALFKRSKTECIRMYNQLKEQRDDDKAEFNEFKQRVEEERKEKKSDVWMWVTSLLAIIAILVSGLAVYVNI